MLWYRDWWTETAQAMRASLLTRATAARLWPRCSLRRRAQARRRSGCLVRAAASRADRVPWMPRSWTDPRRWSYASPRTPPFESSNDSEPRWHADAVHAVGGVHLITSGDMAVGLAAVAPELQDVRLPTPQVTARKLPGVRPSARRVTISSTSSLLSWPALPSPRPASRLVNRRPWRIWPCPFPWRH